MAGEPGAEFDERGGVGSQDRFALGGFDRLLRVGELRAEADLAVALGEAGAGLVALCEHLGAGAGELERARFEVGDDAALAGEVDAQRTAGALGVGGGLGGFAEEALRRGEGGVGAAALLEGGGGGGAGLVALVAGLVELERDAGEAGAQLARPRFGGAGGVDGAKAGAVELQGGVLGERDGVAGGRAVDAEAVELLVGLHDPLREAGLEVVERVDAVGHGGRPCPVGVELASEGRAGVGRGGLRGGRRRGGCGLDAHGDRGRQAGGEVEGEGDERDDEAEAGDDDPAATAGAAAAGGGGARRPVRRRGRGVGRAGRGVAAASAGLAGAAGERRELDHAPSPGAGDGDEEQRDGAGDERVGRDEQAEGVERGHRA
ncbi:MAG: hypothetical protein R3F65_33630, partial [bacterium]